MERGLDPRLAEHEGLPHDHVFALAGPAQRPLDHLDLSVVAALVAEHEPDARLRWAVAAHFTRSLPERRHSSWTRRRPAADGGQSHAQTATRSRGPTVAAGP